MRVTFTAKMRRSEPLMQATSSETATATSASPNLVRPVQKHGWVPDWMSQDRGPSTAASSLRQLTRLRQRRGRNVPNDRARDRSARAYQARPGTPLHTPTRIPRLQVSVRNPPTMPNQIRTAIRPNAHRSPGTAARRGREPALNTDYGQDLGQSSVIFHPGQPHLSALITECNGFEKSQTVRTEEA